MPNERLSLRPSGRYLLNDRCDMQSRQTRLGFIVCKNKHPRALRIHGSVICGRHGVFASIAGANKEWHERRCVQQLANSRNHKWIVREAAYFHKKA